MVRTGNSSISFIIVSDVFELKGKYEEDGSSVFTQGYVIRPLLLSLLLFWQLRVLKLVSLEERLFMLSILLKGFCVQQITNSSEKDVWGSFVLIKAFCLEN